jgi:hypothetical protein
VQDISARWQRCKIFQPDDNGARYFSPMTTVQDGHTKLSPQFPWQKQQSTSRILFSPEMLTWNEGRDYQNATLAAYLCMLPKGQTRQK